MAVQDDAIGGGLNVRRLEREPIARPGSAVAVGTGLPPGLPPHRRADPVNPGPPTARVFRAWAILSFKVRVALTVVSAFFRRFYENA